MVQLQGNTDSSLNENNTPYIIQKLTNMQGLSYNCVKDVEQDSLGNMWIATEYGLNKYNSYSISTYFKEDNRGLPNNLILKLLYTSKNKLIVGTFNGMAIYDEKTDRFKPIKSQTNNFPNVNALIECTDGNVLVGSNSGLFLLEPNSESLTKISTLHNQRILDFASISKHHIWLASSDGIYVITPQGEIISHFNTERSPTLSSNIITALHKDRKGTIWVGSENKGLQRYNPKNNAFTDVKLLDTDLVEAKVVRDITEDTDGNIWVAGELGVFILDPEGNRKINVRHFLEESVHHLNDNATYCLYQSKENIMWVGTYFGGVNYTKLGSTQGFYNIYPGYRENNLRGKAVSALFQNKKGLLWIATEDGGVCKMNIKTKEIMAYYDQEHAGLSSNNIHAISEDKYGRIWLGHFMTGIDIYQPQSNSFYHLPLKENIKSGIQDNCVSSIIRDSKDQMWIGARGAVYRFNYATDKLEPFMPQVFKEKFVYHIFEDSHANIWFCIRYGGVIKYNMKTHEINYLDVSGGLPSNKIISGIETKDGHLWFGTADDGLISYNNNSHRIEVYTMDNGLPSNTVYGILEANDSSLWISTNNGLAQFNPQKLKFRTYGLNYDLAQLQFNYNSYFKDNQGTLYFGTINGLTYFSPEDIKPNLTSSKVFFNDFKLSNISVNIEEGGLLKQHINLSEEITLDYNHKAFTIDFGAINYHSAGDNAFFVKLDGFEKEWSSIGGKTSMSYTNLPSGNYIFMLKAKNNDGIESQNIKTLRIHIRPPFYLSIGAFFLYVLILFSIIIFYLRNQEEKVKNRSILQNEKLEKQRIKELNQQRLNFYTFISHEFKTPLSVINACTDQLKDFLKENEVTNKQIERIQRNSTRLNFLLNQLMDFRKIETKHAKLELRNGDIVVFMNDLFSAFTPLFDSYMINFKFVKNKEAYNYWFDADKIEKIMANLVSNAIRNTPKNGKVVCQLSIFDQTEEKHPRVEIMISNTGKAISKEVAENMFVPFFTKPGISGNGTGIGLTYIKSLIEYLHGRITCLQTDIPTFLIELPLHYHNLPNTELQTEIQRKVTPQTIDEVTTELKNTSNITSEKKNGVLPKLLIVEDTLDLAETLKEHYQNKFQVILAKNGEEALKRIDDEEPDIIISDVMMPKMDGIEFCKRIKKDPKTSHIALILLTAKNLQEDRMEGLAAGAEAYITKPFELKELDLRVHNFIEMRLGLSEKIIKDKYLDLGDSRFQDNDKKFITEVTQYITSHLDDESLNADKLSTELGMSKTLVYLKFKKLLNMTGTDFILKLRLEKAQDLILASSCSISEIAYSVGFSDPKYFSKVFKKNFQSTPSQYRNAVKKK